MSKTLHVLVRRVVRSYGWALIALAVGCGAGPSSSPLAPGTLSAAAYYMLGTVSDKDAHPLANAVVTIVDGPLAGTTTRTNSAGTFELTGGPAGWSGAGLVTLRAGREGFQTATRQTSWRASVVDRGIDGVRFFLLGSLDPSIGLEPGLYTLTTTTDLANARNLASRPNAPCAGFPSDLASRSYRAEIKSSGRDVYTHSVTAEDPTLRWHDLFTFYISGSYVGFDMEGGVGAGIYEDLTGFRYLQIGGSPSNMQPAVRDGSSVSIPFTGAVVYCQLKSANLSDDCSQAPVDQIVEAHVCLADRNTLVFTKR